MDFKEKLLKAKEMLGSTAFEMMAREIPLENVDLEHLKCKSPFNENDNTPSCFWDDKHNCLHCFSTNMNMDFIDFSIKYHHATFTEAVKELFDLVGMEYNDSDFKDKNNHDDYFRNFRFAKEETNGDITQVVDYLWKRKISRETIDYCGIKEDLYGNIAYQFRDINGKLIQTKYRVSKSAKNSEFKWFWQKDTDNCPILYGLDKINFESPLLIVEGLNDRLACIEAGYQNTVSIPGGANDTHWIDFNFDLLDKFDSIILWFDDDEHGKEGCKKCVDRIGVWKTKIVETTSEVKEGISKYYNQFKGTIGIDKVDANNVLVACGKQTVLKMINNAKEVENPLVKHLMDVEELQITDIPRITTGFATVDKVFFGNFQNTLTILTGKPGNGKSSILNTMFVAAPLEAGQKVFIYSGEIPAGVLLGNILKPLASRRHILEFINDGQPNGYSVSKQAAEKIKRFYRDNVFLFNDINSFDTNSKSILQSMEYAYRRYGVENFIIDSLLTVDCSKEDGDDKYEKQKNFVLSLKTFTNKHPVRVALVAHSRKLAPGLKEIGGDDIAGSSDILKCCNKAFSVEILWDDPEGYNTLLRCIKDRETGHIDKEIKLYYDKKSYRVYSTYEELNKEYSWEKQCKIDYSPDLSKRLVSNIEKFEMPVDNTSEIFGEI